MTRGLRCFVLALSACAGRRGAPRDDAPPSLREPVASPTSAGSPAEPATPLDSEARDEADVEVREGAVAAPGADAVQVHVTWPAPPPGAWTVQGCEGGLLTPTRDVRGALVVAWQEASPGAVAPGPALAVRRGACGFQPSIVVGAGPLQIAPMLPRREPLELAFFARASWHAAALRWHAADATPLRRVVLPLVGLAVELPAAAATPTLYEVRDSDNGAMWWWPAVRHHGLSDGTGRVRLAGLPAGRYRLVAWVPPSAALPQGAWAEATLDMPRPQSVALALAVPESVAR